MNFPMLAPERKYTYEDYLALLNDERWELLDSVPYTIIKKSSQALPRGLFPYFFHHVSKGVTGR
jgi:hypothetical protein